MQISEELIKQITNAVLSEMGQETDHIHLPRCLLWQGGTGSMKKRHPTEIIRGRSRDRSKGSCDRSRAAFQKEIKRTICGILLKMFLKNVKAGIEVKE